MTEHSPEHDRIAVEVWKKTVDVQQHFNEICMKIRNLYVTLLAALIALLGTVLARAPDPFFQIWRYDFHSGILVLMTISAGSLLFYFIDLHWYHRLLVGAVKNGLSAENALSHIPGIGLTTAIGNNSPLDLSKRTWENVLLYRLALVLRTDAERLRREKKLHSDAKLAIFYKSVGYFAFIILLLTCLLGGIQSADEEETASDNAASEAAAPRDG